MEELYNNIHDRLRTEKTKRAEKQTKEDTKFKIGDIVYTRNPNRNKKSKKFIGPWQITKLLEHNKCQIKHTKLTNKTKIIHLSDISRPVSGPPPSSSSQE